MSNIPVYDSRASSVALIERELASRPVGATLRVPPVECATAAVQVQDVMTIDAWRSALPTRGPRACAAGCGSTVDMPGLCRSCGSAKAREEAALEFKSALDSIPEKFRWAIVASTDLDTRCGRVLAKSGRLLSASRDVVPRIVGQLLSGAVQNYVLRGDADAGKTSIACAALQLLVDRAVDALIAFVRSKRIGRRIVEPPEPRIVTIARGARFIAARDIAPPRDRGTGISLPAFPDAIKATLLVLDDIGQEIPKRDDGFAATERLQATRDVVTTRWDLQRPILGTTFLSDIQIHELYAGGVQKRLIKSKQVAVIEIHGGKDG